MWVRIPFDALPLGCMAVSDHNIAHASFAFGKFTELIQWSVVMTRAVVTNLIECAFDIRKCELTSNWRDSCSLWSVMRIGGNLSSSSFRDVAAVHMPVSVFHSLLERPVFRLLCLYRVIHKSIAKLKILISDAIPSQKWHKLFFLNCCEFVIDK
jgi:hypothetical protein